MKRFVIGVCAAALTSVAVPASGQLWLRDRAATQGPGIRTGDFELHPGIAAELGYDSNYFQRAPNGGSGGAPIVDTVRLRITPQFHVSTLTAARTDGAPAPPPSVSFSAGAALIYSEFLTHAGPPTDRNSLGRNREFGVAADLALAVAPGRPWGLNLFDNFQRTAQPSLDPDPSFGLDRDDNRAAAEIVHTRPGGLFDWRWGYALGITYFEKSPANDLNNIRHELYTKGRWRFLPRTAFIYDGSVQFVRYQTSGRPGLSDSNPIRTRFGLSGLFTDRVAATLMVGWGASFYAKYNNDFDSVIGQAEVRYYLTGAAPEAGTPAPALSSIAVGFTRDFYNSYFGNWYERDRGYLNISALFARVFYLAVEGGVGAYRYSNVTDRTNPNREFISTPFTTTRVDASLFAEYRVRDWLGFNATFTYLAEITKQKIPYGRTTGDIALEFNRFQALVGIRAFL